MEKEYMVNTCAEIEHVEIEHLGKEYMKILVACALHAILFTFCLYKNYESILTFVWVAGVIRVVLYSFKVWKKELKKGSVYLMVMMAAIAFAGGFTANAVILYLNYPVIFGLLLILLFHNFAENETWDLGKYFAEMIKSCFGALAMIPMPFHDVSDYMEERQEEKDSKAKYVLGGIILSIPCLIILCLLLGSADLVFGNMIAGLFDSVVDFSDIIPILLMLAFGFLASYCILRYMDLKAKDITMKEHHTGEPVLAITFTALISLLYLVFSLIQIAYLFIGNMKLPEGVTYAEYARTGFFQLLFVCIANIVLVLLIKKYFQENKILDAILLVISGCTAIMTVSSALRMVMYIKAYHLTFLRVAVLVALLTIIFLLAGVVLSILKKEFPFVRYSIVVLSVIYLGLSVSHVDYWIASYNLSHMDMEKSGSVDTSYLADLSADAASVILDYEEEYEASHEGSVLYWVKTYYMVNIEGYENMNLRAFNTSGYLAARKFEGSNIQSNQ